MDDDALRSAFDRQASSYDTLWTRLAPINNGLFFILEAIFAPLPSDARVLCVGVGTGTELLHLAGAFPTWTFTAVEPSAAMLDVCRRRIDEAGVTDRCVLHEGYVESLPQQEAFDAATCFLVSQFIMDTRARTQFFAQIAGRLVPGGILANSDLSSDTKTGDYEALLPVWQRVMSPSTAPQEALDKLRTTYQRDVAILPPATVASIIESAGFDTPVQFYQAALVQGWFAHRAR